MGKQVNMSDSCHKIFVGGLKKMAFPRGSREKLVAYTCMSEVDMFMH